MGWELRDHAMVLYGHCKKAGCPSIKGKN